VVADQQFGYWLFCLGAFGNLIMHAEGPGNQILRRECSTLSSQCYPPDFALIDMTVCPQNMDRLCKISKDEVSCIPYNLLGVNPCFLWRLLMGLQKVRARFLPDCPPFLIQEMAQQVA
jgi:hypothetical protein